jgi:hypothetical protein
LGTVANPQSSAKATIAEVVIEWMTRVITPLEWCSLLPTKNLWDVSIYGGNFCANYHVQLNEHEPKGFSRSYSQKNVLKQGIITMVYICGRTCQKII